MRTGTLKQTLGGNFMTKKQKEDQAVNWLAKFIIKMIEEKGGENGKIIKHFNRGN